MALDKGPMFPMDPRKKEAMAKELAALSHAVQSGVAFLAEIQPDHLAPKHTRTGVNLAFAQLDGLARLLMEKGLVTEDEYMTSLMAATKREVASYEDMLEKAYGTGAKIHLA